MADRTNQVFSFVQKGILLCVFLSYGALKPVHADTDFLLRSQRDALAAKGLSFDLHSVVDYATVFNGGSAHRSAWLGRFDFAVNVDTERAGLYKGGTLHVDVMNAGGGGLKPTGEMIGDLQGVDNIEASRTTRLYEAWYQQAFIDGKLSFKAGLHDLNSEFLVSDNGALYINGAFGIMPSVFLNTGVSIYPLIAPGARVKYSPNENFDFLAGVYDGDPGDADSNKHNTHIAVKSQDGLFGIAEGQYHYKMPLAGGLPGTVKLGGWHNSKDIQDVAATDENGDPVIHDDNYGGYAILDQMIFREADEQGLSAFAMGGAAPKDRETVQRSVAAGLNYTGLIPSRDKDVMGVAFTNVFLSNKLRASTGQDRGETSVEWTYKMRINDSIVVQPDFQYVVKPNADDAIKNASIFTLRTDVHF